MKPGMSLATLSRPQRATIKQDPSEDETLGGYKNLVIAVPLP